MSKQDDGSEDVVIASPEDLDKLDGDDDIEEKETPAVSPAAKEPVDDKSEEESQDSEEASEKSDNSEEEDSEDEDVDDTSEDLDFDGGDDSKSKPVVGETSRERALRKEITRLRTKNRDKANRELLGEGAIDDEEPAKKEEPQPEDEEILKGFDPDQVENLGKVFNVWAKQQGLVRKNELQRDNYQANSQKVLNEWLNKHPEYLPENDKGDVLYNKFRDEVALYKKPTTPDGWTKLFNRAHSEIFGYTTKDKAGDKDVKKINAQQEKVRTAAAGSTTSSGTSSRGDSRRQPSKSNIQQVARSGGLRGFSDEELAEMGL